MAAGDPVLAADISTIQGNTSGKPLVRLVQLVTQTGVVNNTVTAVTFTSEDIDTHGYHDNASNTSRITPLKAGYYRFDGGVALSGQTDYLWVEAFIRINGTGTGSGSPPGGRHAGITSSGATLVELAGSVIVAMNGTTDYAEICFRANRTGAGTTATVISSQLSSVFQAEFVRP